MIVEQPAYKPMGIWCGYDFSINKYFWRKVSLEHAYAIRVDNLIDVRKTLMKHQVSNWLQGKTLLGIVEHRDLLDDHDDDLGVFKSQASLILSKVKKSLENMGFALIRNTDDIISFERNFRYIDICLFKQKSRATLGYGRKIFKVVHFLKFDQIVWNDQDFDIPSNAANLLKAMYPKTKLGMLKQRLSGSTPFRSMIRKTRNLPNYIGNMISDRIGKLPRILATLVEFGAPLIGIRVSELTKKKFLDLNVEPSDSFNWKWRARHLGLVTDNGRITRVGDIIDYFSKDEVWHRVDKAVVVTDTSNPFFPPVNFDMRFWWGGNNYFWYCVKYGFRKNVVPYTKVNEYIDNQHNPYIYTGDYYESLPVMSDKEIESFLSKHPIEVTSGAVTSGKHRVFAMIGRMLSGQDYIPLKAVEKFR